MSDFRDVFLADLRSRFGLIQSYIEQCEELGEGSLNIVPDGLIDDLMKVSVQDILR